MDVLRFVNSNAIRDYLRELDYRFNTLEAAFLVQASRYATLKEKHEAYREIIETMPDMAPEDEFCGEHDWGIFGGSIHKLVAYRMATENRWIEEFYAAKHGAYKIRDYHTGFKRYYTYPRLFTELDAVLQFVSETYTDEYERADLISYVITGKPTDTERTYELCFNKNGEIMNVDVIYDLGKRNKAELLFEEMWFGFPTPFKKGDILYDPEWVARIGNEAGPFVFEEIETHRYKRHGKKGLKRRDMVANGLFLDADNNGVYSTSVIYDGAYSMGMINYMSLEYYPEEKLTGEKRILIALSNYKKGEIDETLLLNAYQKIFLEELAKKIPLYLYRQDGLVFAGLEVEED